MKRRSQQFCQRWNKRCNYRHVICGRTDELGITLPKRLGSLRPPQGIKLLKDLLKFVAFPNFLGDLLLQRREDLFLCDRYDVHRVICAVGVHTNVMPRDVINICHALTRCDLLFAKSPSIDICLTFTRCPIPGFV